MVIGVQTNKFEYESISQKSLNVNWYGQTNVNKK